LQVSLYHLFFFFAARLGTGYADYDPSLGFLAKVIVSDSYFAIFVTFVLKTPLRWTRATTEEMQLLLNCLEHFLFREEPDSRFLMLWPNKNLSSSAAYRAVHLNVPAIVPFKIIFIARELEVQRRPSFGKPNFPPKFDSLAGFFTMSA